MDEAFKLQDVNPKKDEIDSLLDIVDFVKQHNISAEELSLAYEVALNIQDEHTPPTTIREEVYALAKKIDHSTRNGLAVNRIHELIGSRKDYETAIEKYTAMLDSMSLSEKEKRMLTSIVNQTREGTLEVVDKETKKKILILELPPIKLIKPNSQIIALHLMHNLGPHIGKKLDLTFIS